MRTTIYVRRDEFYPIVSKLNELEKTVEALLKAVNSLRERVKALEEGRGNG